MSAARDAAYSGTPLPKKLNLVSAKGGVGAVTILGAPDGFLASLGELPDSVVFMDRLSDVTRLGLCFVQSRAALDSLLEMLTAHLPREVHVWLIHPKAHTKPDFNQNHLRDAALAVGLVDYKVCSVNENWSGLKFAWRK